VECAGQVALTGLDGRFAFPGVDRCRATVSAEGFETTELNLMAPEAVRVEMAIAGVTERIVVTATRHETTMEQAGVAATVVTAGELARREYPMVLEVLRDIPGLQVVTTGRQGALTSVFTRGAQRTGTLVLIDGTPVNDPGGEFNFAHLTSSSFERIEVVRGPESALFGAEASAGVVQLFTKRGDPEHRIPRGSLAYERGSFQTDRWMAGLAGGSGSRFDYSLHTEQFHTVGEFPNDHYRNTTGSANVGYRLSPSTQIRGVVRTSDSNLGVPGQVSYGLIDFDARSTNRDSTLSVQLDDARGRHYLQRFSFGYHRVRGLFTNSGLDGSYSLAALVRDVSRPQPRTHLVRLLDPSLIPPEIPAGTRLVTQEVTLFPQSEPFLSATSRKRFGYQGTWAHRDGTAVFGYDYERQEGDVSATDVARNNHGLFLYKQHAVTQRVFLSGGLRVERTSAFGRKVTPRGAASFFLFGEHGPMSSTYLRFSAGRGITEPSLLQNFARESFFVGNPNLRPEKATSYEAGLVQEWFGRHLRTEVAAFHNSFKDLIAFVSLPSPVFGSWRNVESSRARGLEFSARARLVKHVTVSGAYTRLWTRVIRSRAPDNPVFGVGQELARRPGNSGAVSLSVAPRRWWFQAGAVFMGERQDSDFWLGLNRNPGYQNVYAAGSYRLNRHVSPFLRADNLMNTRYQEALGFSNLSRTVSGGIRVEW
jgi:vitamin B12 transporter